MYITCILGLIAVLSLLLKVLTQWLIAHTGMVLRWIICLPNTICSTRETLLKSNQNPPTAGKGVRFRRRTIARLPLSSNSRAIYETPSKQRVVAIIFHWRPLQGYSKVGNYALCATNLIMPDKFYKQKVNELKIRCPNKETIDVSGWVIWIVWTNMAIPVQSVHGSVISVISRVPMKL